MSLLLVVSLLLQAGAYPGDLAVGQLLVATEKSLDIKAGRLRPPSLFERGPDKPFLAMTNLGAS